ncbi:MAG TPA: hypothetical protein VFB45_01810 [Pseudolabrys sp.]|nr:hypothetical protein [Pseudolabrys sp.]
MLLARGLTVAALASAVLLPQFPATSQAQTAAARCEEAAEIAVLPAPLAPWHGVPLRVIVVSEKPLSGELTLVAPDGTAAAASRERHGGPPYFWFAEVAAPAAGTWHASLKTDRAGDCATITRDIVVRAEKPAGLQHSGGGVWPVRAAWSRATENLFSAWIEKLFEDPVDATPSWTALHFVLRDQSRNMLFNYLGLNEDSMGMILRPDCADLPYFLRAYFSFKLGLPFGYSLCSRGGGGAAPRCPTWTSILNGTEAPKPRAAAAAPAAPAPAPKSSNPFDRLFGRQEEERPAPIPVAAAEPAPVPSHLGLAQSFARYLPNLANGVHSGSARTLANDNNTDYYPVPLSQDTLRPGVVYADPYGHVLMIVQRIPEKDGSAGIILAVDGQPDGTVARKRYWRGNFLFAQDPALGSAGFKRFRPIVRTTNGTLRRLANAEIAKDPQYADFSLEQSKLGVEAFYDRMDDVMSPEPLDPLKAMEDAIASLDEQVKVRVQSVENGRKFLASGKGEAAMPDGATIFETIGAWEDFSTPSRDLRLLIALDVVRNYPDRVARRPDRYAMPAGKSVADVKADLQRVLATELPQKKFTYTRSDGSQWTLSLQDVMNRMGLLEMAYNPNDCVELRWGASPNTSEAATCRRFAPAAQRAKMTKYREWFHDRRRPPRA